MKAEIRNVGHEVTYLVVLTITLVVLTILVFPLFIALLPVAFIYGCLEIWRLDHVENKRHESV
jgi:hypothetical protein